MKLAKMKYRVGGFESNSKLSIQKIANRILYEGDLNSVIEGKDLEFMIDYFSQFHIHWKEKRGVGIKAIKRVKEPLYGKHRAFIIERTDNTSTDISYWINKIQKKNYEQEFRQAMREVIKPQIMEYKRTAFETSSILICPLTKSPIHIANSHVDHYEPTFDELIKEFIMKFRIRLTPDLFPADQDNQIIYDINDESIKINFYSFHRERANLRVVSVEGNLRRQRK